MVSIKANTTDSKIIKYPNVTIQCDFIIISVLLNKISAQYKHQMPCFYTIYCTNYIKTGVKVLWNYDNPKPLSVFKQNN